MFTYVSRETKTSLKALFSFSSQVFDTKSSVKVSFSLDTFGYGSLVTHLAFLTIFFPSFFIPPSLFFPYFFNLHLISFCSESFLIDIFKNDTTLFLRRSPPTSPLSLRTVKSSFDC